MSILLTGGAGFIGSNLINYFVVKYPSTFFVNIDCLNYCSDLNNITVSDCKNYKFIEGHIQNHELLNHIFKEYNISTVINLAAQSHVDASFVNPLQTINDNVLGTNVLLEVCRNYNIKKFLHFSTDEVYGESNFNTPNTELNILNPTTPYASSKASIDLIIQSYIKTFNFPAIIVRPNNIYGHNQYIEKLIPKFITLLLDDKKVTIHNIGDNKRSFLYIGDLVNAIDIILSNDSCIGQIYNIGSEHEYSVLDIAYILIHKLKNTMDYNNHIEFIQDRLYNDSRYLVNCDKIKLLGWFQNVDFDTGINNTINYYINNYKNSMTID